MIKHPYQAPRQLATNLWEITGSWSNKLGRRMTVIRLDDGSVWIHNAIELENAELEWLRSLGPVSRIVAPNRFHCSDAGWMKERFPQAQLYVPGSKLLAFAGALDVNEDFPESADLHCIPMRGTRLEEAAFWHVPSETLILTDTAFNMPAVFRGLEKVFMDWNRIGGRFGPSRLTRWVFCTHRGELLNSYNHLLKLQFSRVIVNHGDVLESGGPDLLFKGVTAIFPQFPELRGPDLGCPHC